MNKIIKSSILFLLFIAPVLGHSQVVMQELLTQDHKGVLDKSANWQGKKMYYVLKYDSIRPYQFETYTTNRYYYTLSMADNAGMNNAVKIPGMVRDLVVKTYFEFYFNNGTENKTFTAIYEKYEKWYRIKFAPQAGCRREELWNRVNNITNYNDLLSSIIGQMDNNVKLDCFARQEAKIPAN